MQPGILGAIIGSAFGLVGGIIGTYFSIKNTNGPRERAFMIRVCAIAWIMITAFVAAIVLVPPPYKWLLWAPYGLGLALAISWTNRRQRQIRAEESTAANPMARMN